MTSRLVSFGYIEMTISFLEEQKMVLDDYVKNSTCFNDSKSCAFDNLIPGQFGTCQLFKKNIYFHDDKACCTQL